MNPITGEKRIAIAGKDYLLRYTWRAIAEVESKFGANPNLFDPETLAAVAEAGLRTNHPEMTAEKIMDLSPPIAPFAIAVQEAFKWACFGSEAQGEALKKKGQRLADRGWWSRLKSMFSKA